MVRPRKAQFSTGPVEIVGLEGVFFFVGTASLVAEDSPSFLQQNHTYQSITGARLHIKVTSKIDQCAEYTNIPSSDALSEDRYTWTHAKQTTTGDKRKIQTRAHLTAKGTDDDMTYADLTIQVSGAKPFSIPTFSNNIRLPLG